MGVRQQSEHALEAEGRLRLAPADRARLGAMSAATILAHTLRRLKLG